MPDLVRFVHKSYMGMTKIIRQFRAHWGAKVRGTEHQDPAKDSNAADVSMATNGGVAGHKTNPSQGVMATTPKRAKPQTDFAALEFASGISKRQLERKVQAIAVKEIRPPSNKPLYYVHAEILQEYGFDEENMVSLVSDPRSSSPLLLRADMVKTSTLASPDTQVRQKKKVVPGNHQSLFHFLKSSKSGSPGCKGGNKNSSSGTTLGKHQHSKENESSESDVILVKVTPPSDLGVREPPAKKLHLEGSKCEPLGDNSQPLNV